MHFLSVNGGRIETHMVCVVEVFEYSVVIQLSIRSPTEVPKQFASLLQIDNDYQDDFEAPSQLHDEDHRIRRRLKENLVGRWN